MRLSNFKLRNCIPTHRLCERRRSNPGITRAKSWIASGEYILAKMEYRGFVIQDNPKCSTKGFTLVELLVTMGIFLVMSAAVLANYKGYGNNAYFANASEDIVLALRQAQVYGVGAKGVGVSFTSAYGVYFLANSSQIIIFRDSVIVNSKYDDGEAIETITWKSPITISALTCNGSACVGGNASVTFKRPSPDANIYSSTGGPYTIATITITNGLTPAKTSTITITNAGQISLQ